MVGFWVLIKVFIGKCYRFGMVIGIGYGGAGTREKVHPPLSLFSFPISPADPSYPQPQSKTYTQLAVHNSALLHLVLLFLCIT